MPRRDFFFDPFPIVLKPESDHSTLIRDTIAATADPYTAVKQFNRNSEIVIRAADALMKIGEILGDDPTEGQIRRRDAVRHPLFAALVGQAIYRDAETDFTTWTRRDLITHYFERGRRIPWDAEDSRNEFSETLGPWIGCYVSAATLFRGVDARDMHKCLPDITRQNLSKGNLLRKIVEYCNRIVASDDEHFISPFEPDILGEAFFLKFIERYEIDKYVFNAFIRMISAANIEQNESGASDFVKTIRRLIRNLANDNQSIFDVKNAWYWLIIFLDPKKFIGSSNIRLNISILLIEIIDDKNIQLPNKLRNSTIRNIEYHLLSDGSIKKFSREIFVSIIKMFNFSKSNDVTRSNILNAITKIVSAYKHEKGVAWELVSIASEMNSVEVFRIIQTIFGSDFQIDRTKGGYLLREACRKCCPEIIQGLLDMKANPYQLSFEDSSLPISIACKYGNFEAAKVLFEHGVNLSPKGYVYYHEYSPLMLACDGGMIDIVRWLINNAADIEQYRIKDKKTALIVACEFGVEESVVALLEAGANPNRTMNGGISPLMMASISGNFEIAELLLKAGADPEAKTFNGLDAVYGALLKGQNKIAELIDNWKLSHQTDATVKRIALEAPD